ISIIEFFLEEVYQAITDQLHWNSPEGQQYPHNLLKHLPLTPNSRGRRVIPFDHFINNDLEYLHGGASSRKYTTSVTKTNAADYGHIKWIEDLVPHTIWSHAPVSYDKYALWGISHWGRKRQQFYGFTVNRESAREATDYGHIKWIENLVPRTMWSQAPVSYDKYALWGISHWGHKCQQFYGFTINRESARDVYSKRRIITITELQIVEWHNYKHLDWITMCRDDDKLYKFKEVDLKRLRIQDIEDMLLLLVQEQLNNLTVEERFAFNLSLRMFTRSIVIQRRMEDLQLCVKSYQQKLNLTKLDTYRSDLKRKEAHTTYTNPRGFIYQNKDKQNRLMRIDELHIFSEARSMMFELLWMIVSMEFG
nr:hypothetical protein [Tanacetum cinerariifolium]